MNLKLFKLFKKIFNKPDIEPIAIGSRDYEAFQAFCEGYQLGKESNNE